MNSTHKLFKLEPDDVRGKGYIECNYTPETTEKVPDFLLNR